MLKSHSYGEVNININFSIEYWTTAAERRLESVLKKYYHSDLVFIGGTGTDFHSRDIHLVIDGLAKELESKPKTFIREVATLACRTLRKFSSGLKKEDFEVLVYFNKWNERPKHFPKDYYELKLR